MLCVKKRCNNRSIIIILSVLGLIFLLLVLIFIWSSPTRRETDIRKLLSDKNYNSICLDDVIENKNADEILILFDIPYEAHDDSERLIQEALSVKEKLEKHLEEYKANYTGMKITISFIANYAPTSIEISNYDECSGVPFDHSYDLHYGRFTCSNASLSDVQGIRDFQTLKLYDFSDYSDAAVLDTVQNLKYLDISYRSGAVSADVIAYLKQAHPGCEIIE